MNLTETCTQQAFGDMVGIGQPAVSDLLARTIIQPGHTAGQWLLDYTAHLREQAAGRGADGELAGNRAKESFTRNQLLEMKLRVMRQEYAPVGLIGEVIATVGRTIAGVLEPVHNTLHKMNPNLTPEDLKFVQTELSRACDMAATASLDLLTVDEEPADVPDDVPMVEEETL